MYICYSNKNTFTKKSQRIAGRGRSHVITYLWVDPHPGAVMAPQVSDVHHDVALVHVQGGPAVPGPRGSNPHPQRSCRENDPTNLWTHGIVGQEIL